MPENTYVDQLHPHGEVVSWQMSLARIDVTLGIATDGVCADDGRTGMVEIRAEGLRREQFADTRHSELDGKSWRRYR